MGRENFFVWRDEYPEGFRYPGKEELPQSGYGKIAESFEEGFSEDLTQVEQTSVPEHLLDDFLELEEEGENPYTVFDEYPEVREAVFSAVSKSWFRRILMEDDIRDRLEGERKDYLESHILAALGSREAARLSLDEGGNVFHNGGGHHHASRGAGYKTPFNLINDEASAIEYIKDELDDPDIAVIDLDLHFGDGTVSIYGSDPDVNHFSMHQWNNFPRVDSGWWTYTGGGKAEGQTLNMPLPDSTGGEQYLSYLDQLISSFIDHSDPDIVFYQAGTDPHHEDPEGDLNLTLEDLYERDRKVFESTKSPIITLAGGGYGPRAADASINTMAAMVDEPQIIKEKGLTEEKRQNAESASEKAENWFRDLLEYEGHGYLG